MHTRTGTATNALAAWDTWSNRFNVFRNLGSMVYVASTTQPKLQCKPESAADITRRRRTSDQQTNGCLLPGVLPPVPCSAGEARASFLQGECVLQNPGRILEGSGHHVGIGV